MRQEKGYDEPIVLEKHVLVYDKDCGSCSRFKRIVNSLDGHKKLDYRSLTEADEQGLLDSVQRSRRHRSFHLISPGGRVISGSAAIPDLISLLPSGRVASFWIRHAPGGRKIVNLIYSTFSRSHDSGSCSYPYASVSHGGEGRKILPKGTGSVGNDSSRSDRLTSRKYID